LKKLRWAKAGSAFLVAMAAWSMTAPALAATTSASKPRQEVSAGELDIPAAQLAFEQERAAARGMAVEAIRAEDRATHELGMLAGQLEGAYDDLYVQAEWRPEVEPHAQIVLHGDIHPEAQALIDAASFDIDISVSSGPSRWQSAEITMSMIRAIAERGGIDAGGSFDPLDDVYTISYSGRQLGPEEEQEVTSLGNGNEVRLGYLGAEPSAGTTYIGGNGIAPFASSPTGWQCTAGFTVRNGATFGVATAEHCPVNRAAFRYQGVDFSYGGSLDPMKGDVEWGWALSGTAEPSVRTTLSQVMGTSQIVGPVIGMGHCKFGWTSYTSCSTITGLNHCQDYTADKVSYCNLVVDAAEHAKRGDSGGPQFALRGTTAAPLGFTSGWYSDFWGKRHTLFSAATALYHFANVKAYY
jgi:hypothetical protein